MVGYAPCYIRGQDQRHPKFGKRHYDLIAKAIAEAREDSKGRVGSPLDLFVAKLIHAFQADNPGFRPLQFTAVSFGEKWKNTRRRRS